MASGKRLLRTIVTVLSWRLVRACPTPATDGTGVWARCSLVVLFLAPLVTTVYLARQMSTALIATA